MKRIIAILAACLLIISFIPKVKALSASDEGPGAALFSGFDDLGSTRAALMDLDSGAVIYQRNAVERAKPGSLTVIMTAMLLIENTSAEEWDVPLSALAQVNSSWSGRGAQMGLKKGDSPTRRDLLHGMLLMGAADAAFVTEMLVSGSESAFVEAMNLKADELGLQNTRFENGYGLGSNGHYTCALDMAVVTAYAMENELFASVVKTQNYTCSEGCGHITLSNSNPELMNSGCIGVKSGADSEKEHSLALASEAGSARLTAIILEAPSDEKAASFADRLISAGFSLYLSEGGLVSYTPTNALIKAKASSGLTADPNSSSVDTVTQGEILRAIGYHEDANGLRYCVWRGGRALWADSRDMELICFIDDVFIENGPALSSEYDKGDAIIPDAFVTSRHTIVRISVTLSLPDGTLAFKGDLSPMAHNINCILGSELADSISSLSIREGLYKCTVEAEALCEIPGVGSNTITKTETSTLAIGTGGECVSYNSNMGFGSPEGECFFDSFTVTSDTPERTGHVFSGWNTAADGSGTAFSAGDTLQPEDSLTLYAMWQPGKDERSFEGRALYEGSLIVEGFASNPAGITSMRMLIKQDGGTYQEFSSSCSANTVQLGDQFLSEAVFLPIGAYSIEIYGSSGGGEEKLLYSQELTVGKQEITPEPEMTPEPEQTEEPGPNDPGFSLAGLPIFLWFVIGAAVVAVLIWLIIYIIKKG